MDKKGKNKHMSVEEMEEKSLKALHFIETLVDENEEMEEKSLKVLHFIENLVDENKDGIVTSGDVMALLGGTINLFLKDVKWRLSEERAKQIKSGLVMVVMMA
jgi:hypothetical protein